MKRFQNHCDYEPLRTWALHPSSLRPSGLAQLLSGGVVTWLHTAQSLPAVSWCENTTKQTTPGVTTSLSTLVATMIAEVLS